MAAATVARPTYTVERAGGNRLEWTPVLSWHLFPFPNNLLKLCQGTTLSLEHVAPILGVSSGPDGRSASAPSLTTVIGKEISR